MKQDKYTQFARDVIKCLRFDPDSFARCRFHWTERQRFLRFFRWQNGNRTR